MNILTETFTLNNGTKIPKVGFGTWQIPNGQKTYDAVTFALKAGYRHIDTAWQYHNEESVGKAIRDSGIDRSEIYVTSKLPSHAKSYEKTFDYFEITMKNLDLEYIDLYIIHAPWPWTQVGADYRKENREVWKAMEEIYKTGRVKAIGVSNFVVSDLESLLEVAQIVPAVNQIKYYIGYTQDDTVRLSEKNGILVEAYSPLATGALLENETVAEIARKYNKSVAQISLRFVIQNGLLPLPKSTHADRIKQNIDLDFEISEEDMKYLNGLNAVIKDKGVGNRAVRILQRLRSVKRKLI